MATAPAAAGVKNYWGEEQKRDTPYDSVPTKFRVIKLNNEYTIVFTE